MLHKIMPWARELLCQSEVQTIAHGSINGFEWDVDLKLILRVEETTMHQDLFHKASQKGTHFPITGDTS